MTTRRRPSGAIGKGSSGGDDSPMKRFERLARGVVSVPHSEIKKNLRKPIKKRSKKQAAP